MTARILGPHGRGQIALAILWTSLIQMIGTLGIPSALTFFLARDLQRRGQLVNWCRKVGLAQAAASTVVAGTILFLLHRNGLIPARVAAVFSFWPAGATFNIFGVCYLQGTQRFSAFNAFRLLSGTGTALALLAEYMLSLRTISEVALAYVAPACVGGTVALFVLWKGSSQKSAPLDSLIKRQVMSYSIRSLASFSGLALNQSSDQLALGLLIPVGQLGYYSVASSASSPLSALVSALGITSLPALAAAEPCERGQRVASVLRRATISIMLLMLPTAFLLPWAIRTAYGPRFGPAVGPAEVLLAGGAFAALTSVSDDILRAYDRPGFVGFVQTTGGLVTVVGAVLLSRHVLYIAAMASTAGFATSALLSLLKVRSLCQATAGGRAVAADTLAGIDGVTPE